MRRLVAEQLLAWKDAPDRHPLLVRGAPVGKTWSIVDFGQTGSGWGAAPTDPVVRRRGAA